MTMQFVKAPPAPPRLSARVQPDPLWADDGLTLQWERVTGLAKEISPLFREHWDEIALFKDSVALEPNWDLYFQYDILGLLHVLTVRADGVLVGYAFLIISPHLHYASTRYAHFDMFWLRPAFRKGLLGYRLLKESVVKAKELKADVMYAAVKRHFKEDRGTVGKLLERLGFEAQETVYYKLLR
jgi:GNAT superfamily N-acetyltransferase